MFVKVQRNSFPYGQKLSIRALRRSPFPVGEGLNFQKDLTFFMESFMMNRIY